MLLALEALPDATSDDEGNAQAAVSGAGRGERRRLAYRMAVEALLGALKSIIDHGTASLRIKLLREELDELECAFINADLVEILDAVTDLQYVLVGRHQLQVSLEGGEQLMPPHTCHA